MNKEEINNKIGVNHKNKINLTLQIIIINNKINKIIHGVNKIMINLETRTKHNNHGIKIINNRHKDKEIHGVV